MPIPDHHRSEIERGFIEILLARQRFDDRQTSSDHSTNRTLDAALLQGEELLMDLVVERLLFSEIGRIGMRIAVLLLRNVDVVHWTGRLLLIGIVKEGSVMCITVLVIG